MTIMMPTDLTADSPVDHQVLAHAVLRLWSARAQNEIPSVAAGVATLTSFIPVLYDNIAELICPDGPRPFGRIDDLHTDDVVEELQIFRGVLFSVAREHALQLSATQCEQVGQLIDATIRQAIVHCTAVERAMHELVISELSHELRNPLNIASALAQLIERRPDNEKVAQMAGRISQKIAETDALLQTHVDTLRRQSASA
jgi:signal transduction histidine kinase